MSQLIPLKIEDLSIKLGGGNIFNNLNLEVMPKEFVTVMGENGSGKTTLINILLGHRIPRTGNYSFFGRTKDQEVRNKKIGWVMSHKEQYPPMLSINELIQALRPLYPSWDMDLEKKLIQDFTLNTNKKLNDLSLGESSKVKLLKALAFRPDLLVLDELTANLSDGSKKTILSTLIGLFEETQMAVLYISHSKEEALKLSDRIFDLTPQGLIERKG